MVERIVELGLEYYMIKRKTLGNRGEKIAVNFLRRRGYQIIERNYRSFLGEIDIVAKEGENIVFVEVKTRSSTDFGLPEEALSYDKRCRLTRLALNYLTHHKIKNVNSRFDVVSILMDESEVENIQLIKDAFPATY